MHIRLPPFLAMLAIAVAGFLVASIAAAQVTDMVGIAIRIVVYVACCLAFLGLLWRDPASKAQLMAVGAPVLGKLRKAHP